MANHLEQLLVEELKDLYSAEKQILRALPKLVRAASDDELRRTLEEHRKLTEEHVQRLDVVFDQLESSPGREKCKGMAGLLEEGEDRLTEEDEGPARDATIIASAQRVEHYEMAGYGTARTYAEHLGFSDAARLLQTTLNEEGEADRRLTQLAEVTINAEAAAQMAPAKYDSDEDDQ